MVIPVKPRTFGLVVVGVAMLCFGAVIAANLLIDPNDVFDTGLIRSHQTANTRVQVVRKYQETARSVDGLIFSSSRGWLIPMDRLSVLTNSTGFASFGVGFGRMPDHLANLEFVLRDKVARGERLRIVFLMLDMDLFGERSVTNKYVQTLLPPVVSGDSRVRFWLSNLTTFQWRSWRIDLERALNLAAAEPSPAGLDAEPPTNIRLASMEPVIALPSARRLERISEHPEFVRQFAMLKRFVELCRQNDIDLVIATSPLRREQAERFDPVDMASVIDSVSRLNPIWDFDAPDWLSRRADLWVDINHFSTEVGRMMLDRIFLGATPAEDRDFGRLRSSAPR